MYSLSFPINDTDKDIFSSASTNLLKDHEATKSNLYLLLHTWKNSLFGDPYFGTNLKKFIYEQNNTILRDLVIDDIYTSIITFMPQLYIERKNINVTSDGTSIYIEISCTNKIDNQNDLFSITLTEDKL